MTPDSFAGDIGIEWPAEPWGREGGFLAGWPIRFYNGDGYVHTVTEMALHANVDDLMWAELTMYAGADGKPLLAAHDITDPDRTGKFAFLITGMRHGDPGARNLTGEQQRAIDPRLRAHP